MAALTWHGNSPREAEVGAGCTRGMQTAGVPLLAASAQQTSMCSCAPTMQWAACSLWCLSVQVERKSQELRKLMREAGLQPRGPVHVWQYGERGLCVAGRMAQPGHAAVQRCPSSSAARHLSPPKSCCCCCVSADPPFQWGIFRTNEVLFEVEGGAAAAAAGTATS